VPRTHTVAQQRVQGCVQGCCSAQPHPCMLQAPTHTYTHIHTHLKQPHPCMLQAPRRVPCAVSVSLVPYGTSNEFRIIGSAGAVSVSVPAPYPCLCRRRIRVCAGAASVSVPAPYPCLCRRRIRVCAGAASVSVPAPHPCLSRRIPCHTRGPEHASVPVAGGGRPRMREDGTCALVLQGAHVHLSSRAAGYREGARARARAGCGHGRRLLHWAGVADDAAAALGNERRERCGRERWRDAAGRDDAAVSLEVPRERCCQEALITCQSGRRRAAAGCGGRRRAEAETGQGTGRSGAVRSTRPASAAPSTRPRSRTCTCRTCNT
jgi:hypothetical protein